MKSPTTRLVLSVQAAQRRQPAVPYSDPAELLEFLQHLRKEIIANPRPCGAIAACGPFSEIWDAMRLLEITPPDNPMSELLALARDATHQSSYYRDENYARRFENLCQEKMREALDAAILCLQGWIATSKPNEQVGANEDDPPGGGKKTIGERMAEIYTNNRSAASWDSEEWARQLECDPSSIRKTKIWKAIAREGVAVRLSKTARRGSVK